MADVQAIFYVYSGLIAGNITLVTVVVSINQLMLSRELQTPGEVRSQISIVIDYRSAVEGATGEIAPVEPMGFLHLFVEAAREEAQRLGGLDCDDAGRVVGREIDEATASAIDELIDRLQEIDVARQYFKTIYLQQELSLLSRQLVYVGIPAVALAMVSLLLMTVPPDRPWLIPNVAFVPVTFAAGTLPLLLLGSYTLRMATVTNLTAATLPFTTAEQEQ